MTTPPDNEGRGTQNVAAKALLFAMGFVAAPFLKFKNEQNQEPRAKSLAQSEQEIDNLTVFVVVGILTVVGILIAQQL